MQSTDRKKLSVIVPFLNEEENLPILHERMAKAMEGQPEDLEIIFIDDGSTDGSARWAAEASRKDPRVKLLRLSRNFGHQIAITAGMDYAEGDAVVIIDADLQDPPEVVIDLLKKWREGYDVVYAVRSQRQGETLMKKFLAATFYRVFHRMANVNVPMDAGDFRLVDRKVIMALREVRELHRFMRGLTCWVGFSQCAVTYERAARHAGTTKYPVWKSLRLAWDAITSFSGVPLRMMMGLGVIVSLGGMILALRMVISKLFNIAETVPGWTSQMAMMLILGGIQLVCLGLLGQYVSRVFEESKKRPLYFIREKVGSFGPASE
jgi:glycosyltransferase involved in cell wall biosynthesis